MSVWNPGPEIYGLGHEHLVPLLEIDPPPPPDPQNPAGPFVPFTSVSLRVQPSSGVAGGIVLSWPSLDYGGAVVYHIEGTLHQGWVNAFLFAQRYDDFYFFIHHPMSAGSPPVENPPLGTLDSAMVTSFEAHLPDMNQLVADSAARARETPPPAPSSPDSRLFVRIVADWSRDTDGDGSPDWAEFEVSSDTSHSQNALADAFAADVNGDGIPDGDQLDNDGDGIVNSLDVGIDDPLIDWEKPPVARYAVFSVQRSSPSLPPLHIVDQGSVLFMDGLWVDGSFHQLDMQGTQADGIQAIGMNDLGQILGIGYRKTAPPSPSPGGGLRLVTAPEILVWWNSRFDDGPVPVSDGNNDAEDVLGSYFGRPDANQALMIDVPFDCVLDNEGRFIARRPGDNPGDPDVRRVWQRTESGFGEAEMTGESTLFTFAPNYSYGPVGHGSEIWESGSLSASMPGVVSRLAKLPSGRLGAVRLGAQPLISESQTVWKESGYFNQSVADLNQVGSFPLAGIPEFIYHKVGFSPLAWEKMAPGQAQAASGQLRHLDGTPSGWLLSSQDSDHFASMPIFLDDESFATGVDPVSISSTNPGSASQERTWIMAGIGRNQVFSIASGANPNARVTMAAEGASLISYSDFITPGGPPTSGDLLLETPQTFAVIPGNSLAASLDGSEIYPTFTLGGASSLSTPVGIKVMKKRTVKVKVWVIPRKYGADSSQFFDPEFIPTKAQLDSHLTEIYGPQINADFDCDVERIDPLAYDSTDPEDFGGVANGPAWDGGNGRLDDFGSYMGELDDVSADIDSSKSVNVYLVGGAEGGQEVIWNAAAGSFGIKLQWSGLTDVDGRRCWVIGGSSNPGVSKIGEQKILDTIAHEIGHVVLGEGHPDDEGGVEALPGTDRKKRLMCSGPRRYVDGRSRLLVKAEWDKAEAWMTTEEEDGRIGP